MQKLGLYLALIIMGFAACESAVKQEAKLSIEEMDLASVEMKIEGMVCAMGCAKFIEKEVGSQNGVAESKVDFEKEVAYFSYDQNQWKAEEIEKFIDEIHDGQYNATIIASLKEKEKAEPAEVQREKAESAVEAAEADESMEEAEEQEMTSVVHQIQNISFPELLTYFINRI